MGSGGLKVDPRLASAVAELIDQDRPPTHRELDLLFQSAGLADLDPGTTSATPVGKLPRVRTVLSMAVQQRPEAASRLSRDLVDRMAAGGCFNPESPTFVGDQLLANLKQSLKACGWDLSADAVLVPVVVDGLDDAEADAALEQIIRRARTGAQDAALVTGSGKDLLEAVLRQILIEKTGSYQQSGNFPMTLFNTFDRLGLPSPPQQPLSDFRNALDPDPRKRFVQVLYLLAWSVNDLRNAQGTGHGRPFPSSVTDKEAAAAVQAMALVATYLRASR